MTKSAPVLRGLGLLVGAIFCVVSVTANARYAVTQGQHDLDWWLYLGVAVAVDSLKILMPLFAVMLWERQFRGAARIAWGIAACSLAMSLVSAIGWSSTSSGGVSAARDQYNKKYAAAEKAVLKLEGDIERLPGHRPAPVIEGLINANTVPAKTWRSSLGCTNATTEDSRRDCLPVVTLRAELATAVEAAAMGVKLSAARLSVAGLVAPREQADPAAATLVTLSRDTVTAEEARAALNGWTAFLIEAGSAAMFTLTILATGGGASPHVPPPAPATSAVRAALPTRPTPPLGVGAKVLHVKALSPSRPPPPQPPRATLDGDPLAAWAAERLETVAGGSVTTSGAHVDYMAWSRGKGAPAFTPQQFGIQVVPIVADAGGVKVKRRDARYFEGVRLKGTA